MENIYDKIQESANFIESKSEVKPSIGLILGSGLGVLADEIQNPVKIKYNEIEVWQHPGKSVFFYAKNRAPPRGSAQGTCCARLSLSAPKSRGNPRDIPRLPRGAVSRVCACAVARVGRVGVWCVCVCRACRRVRAQGAFPAAEPPILPEIR